jgi:lysosomal Pro-X carboxypeptidase
MSLFLMIASLALLQLFSLAAAEQMNTNNCTWMFIEQPLSHMQRAQTGTYQQRLCVFDGYWKKDTASPVFLYTGNESPVEEYVNATGLLWNLAKKFNALVVFAEHRYFGESIPQVNGMDNCIQYLTSEEALADYAALCNRMRRE